MTAQTKKTAAKKAPVAATKTAPVAQAVASAAPRPTRSGVAYALIKKGATNLEVLTALKAQFNLPEKHSYYPAWYRAALVMKGEISSTFAAEHRGPAIRRSGPNAGEPMGQTAKPTAAPAPAAKPEKATPKAKPAGKPALKKAAAKK